MMNRIEGFKEHYSGVFASEDGEIFVPESGVHSEHYTYGSCTNNYLHIIFRGKRYSVHRIVYETFLNNNEPLPSGFAIHHINHNPEDNRISNLEKLSSSEHQKLHMSKITDATRRKMSAAKKMQTGKLHPKSKPVVGINIKTGEVVEFECTMEVKRKLGINYGHIAECCRGKRKSAGGFLWHYK